MNIKNFIQTIFITLSLSSMAFSESLEVICPDCLPEFGCNQCWATKADADDCENAVRSSSSEIAFSSEDVGDLSSIISQLSSDDNGIDNSSSSEANGESSSSVKDISPILTHDLNGKNIRVISSWMPLNLSDNITHIKIHQLNGNVIFEGHPESFSLSSGLKHQLLIIIHK